MEWFNDVPQYVKYFVSIVGSIVAILGLFVDRAKGYFKYIAPMFIGFVLLLGVFQLTEKVSADRESDEAKSQRNILLKLVDEMTIASVRMSAYLSDILLSQPKILADFGLTEIRAGKSLDEISTADLKIGQILEANEYRAELIATRTPSSRVSTQIWYYNKEMDTPELRRALSEVGFTVKNFIAQRNQKNDPTNAVWHGPGVDLDDYKAVIVSLIRAGIYVRRVGPSCRNLENKYNVIEVGASDLAAGLIKGITKPAKTINEIRDASSFEDLDDFACD